MSTSCFSSARICPYRPVSPTCLNLRTAFAIAATLRPHRQLHAAPAGETHGSSMVLVAIRQIPSPCRIPLRQKPRYTVPLLDSRFPIPSGRALNTSSMPGQQQLTVLVVPPLARILSVRLVRVLTEEVPEEAAQSLLGSKTQLTSHSRADRRGSIHRSKLLRRHTPLPWWDRGQRSSEGRQ